MKPDEMKLILREWGMATVNRYCVTRADRSVHMLDQAREMAPGTVANATKALVGRDGEGRRILMAKAAEVPKMRIVPKWACDPIRATNNAGRPHDNQEIAVDGGIPAHLMWVEREIASMRRQFLLRALVVTTEYTVSASQAVKARIACREFEKEMAQRLRVEPPPEDTDAAPALTVRQYRAELEKSIDWFLYRVAA